MIVHSQEVTRAAACKPTIKMAGLPKRNWDPNSMYDITPDEKRAMQERAQMRSALKAEWQKKVTNPYRGSGGYIVSVIEFQFLEVKFMNHSITMIMSIKILTELKVHGSMQWHVWGPAFYKFT